MDAKLAEHRRKMTLPIPIIKRKRAPELHPKSIPTCQVVQFTETEIDTLKQVEHVVYPVSEQHSDSRTKHEINTITSEEQMVSKIELNMESKPVVKQNDKIPSLQGVVDKRNGKILYIPLTEMKSLCRIEASDQQLPAQVLNLSSIKNFQDLQYREYRAATSPHIKLDKLQEATHKSRADVEGIRSLVATRGGSHLGLSYDEECDLYREKLRNSLRKNNLSHHRTPGITPNPLVSKSLTAMSQKAILVLPEILVQDANKHKTGRDKVLQQKFDETIKIYQRTKEKISELERIAQLHAQQKTSKSLPKKAPLHVNTARRTQSEGRVSKRQLPKIDSLNNILSHTPAIRCPTSPPPPKRNTVNEKLGSDFQQSNASKPSRQTPRKVLTDSLTEKRKLASWPKQTLESETLASETPREATARQMFQTSDYDQYCHTKHRRSRHSVSSQMPIRTPRDVNHDPKEYLKVKIGTEPRLLDDNDYVTNGVQSNQPSDAIKSTNSLPLMINELMDVGKLSDTEETIALPRLVAMNNQNTNAKSTIDPSLS